jgi:hypothetical protein
VTQACGWVLARHSTVGAAGEAYSYRNSRNPER